MMIGVGQDQAVSVLDLQRRLSHFCSEYHSTMIAAILFFALAIRGFALFSWDASLYGDFLSCDEQVYHQWAKALAEGAPRSPVVHDFTPLYAYIAAAVYKMFGVDPMMLRIMNMVFGVSACGLMYLVGKELGGRIIGFFSCLLSALYKPLIFFSITVMKTSLSIFLFALLVYLLLRVMRFFSLSGIFLLGLVMGLLLNVRANCLLIIPVVPAVLIYLLGKRVFSVKSMAIVLGVYGAGVFLAISPFSARTYHINKGLSLSVPGGYNFFMGYNPDNPYPYYRPAAFASSSTSTQAVQFIIEASRRANRKLTPGEASKYWTLETLKWGQANPGQFARKTFQKTLAVFNRFESADNFDIDFISKFVPVFQLPFIPIWMLLPFGFAGILVTAGRSHEACALTAVLSAYTITLIIIFTSIRIRLPLMIILIPVGLLGLRSFFENIQNRCRKQITLYVSAVLVFLTVSFLPIPGMDDPTAHYNAHAYNLYLKGFKTEAIAYWEKSSRLAKPYSAFADLSLADHYLQEGDLPKTLHYLNKIPDNSFSAARKYAKMGDLKLKQKNRMGAISAYEKSLEINSGQRTVLVRLAKLYRNVDLAKSDRIKNKLIYISEFYRTEGAQNDKFF